MFKALLKKQFLELVKLYLIDKKGKRRSAGSIIGYVILFGFVFLSVGMMFFMVADGLYPLVEAGLDWFYFSMLGMMTIFVGLFGSVFTTYTSLYLAKDNDLLLSMPIPPSVILGTRMITVYATSLLYSALVWIPALVRYFSSASASGLAVLLSILTLPVIALVVHVLTCFLGWGVALISVRLKNKSIITVVISLAFLALYYIVYFRINVILSQLIADADKVSAAVRVWAYPFYQMGLGASGEGLPFLLFAFIALALFALTYFILSKTFISIITRSASGKKAVYHEHAAKEHSVRGALIRKEAKKFVSSSVYMLNTGIGIVIMLAAAVLAVIKSDVVLRAVGIIEDQFGSKSLVPVAVTVCVCMMASINCISAPSISLEGKKLEMLQALPIRPYDIIQAKMSFHFLVNIAPAIILTATLGILAGIEGLTVFFMSGCVMIFCGLSGEFGLLMNILRPNLNWTNEAVPIKQSMSVVVTMFGGWALCILTGIGYLFLYKNIQASKYLLVVFWLYSIFSWLIRLWLKNKGAEKLAHLQ